MKRFNVAAVAALVGTMAVPATGHGQEVPRYHSTADGRESVSVTIYNGNFGLVRETRRLQLGSGIFELEFGDVASTIQPETVHLRALDGRLEVLEQNYRYDLLSPQKLLEKYVGRTVRLARWNPEKERDEYIDAEVLSVNQGTIFRTAEGITYNYPGRIVFPDVPDNLIASPTLVWLLNGNRDRQDAEISYLAGGMNWRADYVMVVGENDDVGDLTGWVTLTNNSGAEYRNALLKLVAGDVQRVGGRDEMRLMAKMAVAEADAAGFTEEGFFEYHLYTLGRPTNLKQNEQKQVTLLEARDFGVKKRLQFYGQMYWYRGAYGQIASNQKVGVFLELRNTERNGLGMALPAGVVRVYKEDGSGAQQFIGEDRIDHTPRDEKIRIRMGEAFDVVADRTQTDYTVISSCVSESSWEIEIRNHKDQAETVEVIEPVGGDWEILSSSHRVTKVDAFTFKFEVKVPARGEQKITYRVRTRWC